MVDRYKECCCAQVHPEGDYVLFSEHEALLVKYEKMIASGALVPVPDGEPCLLDALQRHQFVLWDGSVWVYGPLACELVRITDNHRASVRDEFCNDVKFQPVRLVPIGQVEL